MSANKFFIVLVQKPESSSSSSCEQYNCIKDIGDIGGVHQKLLIITRNSRLTFLQYLEQFKSTSIYKQIYDAWEIQLNTLKFKNTASETEIQKAQSFSKQQLSSNGQNLQALADILQVQNIPDNANPEHNYILSFNEPFSKVENAIVYRLSQNTDGILTQSGITLTPSSPRTSTSGTSGGKRKKTKGSKKSSTKTLVLGRERVVTKVGRKSMVTYKGKQMGLTEARQLERELKKKKK
jgi:hypothetical protein